MLSVRVTWPRRASSWLRRPSTLHKGPSGSRTQSSFSRNQRGQQKQILGRLRSLVWEPTKEFSTSLDKIFVEDSPRGNGVFLSHIVGRGRWCRRKDGKPGLVGGFITCVSKALPPPACLFTAISFQCLHPAQTACKASVSLASTLLYTSFPLSERCFPTFQI